MKDYLISQFIDNELELDEKIDLVELVHEDKLFKDEAIDFLRQEKLLRGDMATKTPVIHLKERTSWKTLLFPSWRPILTTCFLATIAMIAFSLFHLHPSLDQDIEQRFVIYRPHSHNMAIMGTFTDWRPHPMEKIGSSGYWSLTLKLNPGEHHYSYVTDDGQQLADPTILMRESDDFGGENSIINVSKSI